MAYSSSLLPALTLELLESTRTTLFWNRSVDIPFGDGVRFNCEHYHTPAISLFTVSVTSNELFIESGSQHYEP